MLTTVVVYTNGQLEAYAVNKNNRIMKLTISSANRFKSLIQNNVIEVVDQKDTPNVTISMIRRKHESNRHN